ncbi:MAG: hypothetical protein F6K17_04835 [Okeania sp. SIO3C4]|nr:hypothetical protein [Okeania sp. SIO3B3]NER02008.1 hypothetical protein [Okeania sp. SIO3C4]
MRIVGVIRSEQQLLSALLQRNGITTEEFYEKWYSDRNHYKKVLGNLVLDLMFSYPERPENVPVDFGTVINLNNIEQHLQKIREDQKNYHRKFAK